MGSPILLKPRQTSGVIVLVLSNNICYIGIAIVFIRRSDSGGVHGKPAQNWRVDGAWGNKTETSQSQRQVAAPSGNISG